MATLTGMKPKSAVEKRTRTTVDTLMLTPELISKWKLPSGQRPLTENRKLHEVSDAIKADGGVIPGILTIGVVEGQYYIVDGQHRIHAFKLTGLKEGYADVRLVHAESEADLNIEFVELNSSIARMRPDDNLRALEGHIDSLRVIRFACPFVGYGKLNRQGGSVAILSMSNVLRVWRGSAPETPVSGITGMGARELAETMVDEETRWCTDFLILCHEAFGRDMEYSALWGSLNMGLCAWLYRRMVVTQYSAKTPRLNKDQFKEALMSLSTNSTYLQWLVGRRIGDRDRSPAYARLRTLFSQRLEQVLGKKVQMPSPGWSNS